MLTAEARWVAQALSSIPTADLSPLLSVGSGTEEFRTKRQPWIDHLVFAPLAARGVKILHHELEPADGIDIVGDLGDQSTRDQLAALSVRTVLCCNVLEHVPERAQLAEDLATLVPAGGNLIVTVPHRFPYHPDPLDTMFRPDAKELAALFPALETRRAEVVQCEPLLGYWLRSPKRTRPLINGARSLLRRPRRELTPAADRSVGDREPLRSKLTMAFLCTSVSCAHITAPGSNVAGHVEDTHD